MADSSSVRHSFIIQSGVQVSWMPRQFVLVVLVIRRCNQELTQPRLSVYTHTPHAVTEWLWELMYQRTDALTANDTTVITISCYREWRENKTHISINFQINRPGPRLHAQGVRSYVSVRCEAYSIWIYFTCRVPKTRGMSSNSFRHCRCDTIAVVNKQDVFFADVVNIIQRTFSWW